ncbi:MAG: nucleotidyltransferase family protein [Pseudomonadota bacterium]
MWGFSLRFGQIPRISFSVLVVSPMLNQTNIDSRKDKTNQVLIRLCRIVLSPSDCAFIRENSSQTDWQQLFWLACCGGVAGLVTQHLVALRFPMKVVQKFSVIGLHVGAQNKELMAETTRLCETAENGGLVLIPIKGAALNMGLPYEDLSLRAMCDLDLVTGREQIAKVEQLLLDHGYREQRKRAQSLLYSHHMNYVKYRGRTKVLIELHWTPFFEAYGDLKTDREIIERSQVHCHNGAKIRMLDPEDMYLSLVLHLAVHRYRSRLKWLVDLAEYCRTKEKQICWEKVWDTARDLGGLRAAAYGTLLARDLLEAPVPNIPSFSFLPILRQFCPESMLISSRPQPSYGERFLIDFLLHDSPLSGMRQSLHKAVELLDRYWAIRLPHPIARRNPLE